MEQLRCAETVLAVGIYARNRHTGYFQQNRQRRICYGIPQTFRLDDYIDNTRAFDIRLFPKTDKQNEYGRRNKGLNRKIKGESA